MFTELFKVITSVLKSSSYSRVFCFSQYTVQIKLYTVHTRHDQGEEGKIHAVQLYDLVAPVVLILL